MVKIGDKVFQAGNWMENTKTIIVTEKNINMIIQFWNKLYFDNQEEANKIMNVSKADYATWLYSYM